MNPFLYEHCFCNSYKPKSGPYNIENKKFESQIYSVTSTHIGIIERFMQLFLSASSVGKYKLNKNSNTKLLTGCLFVETYTQNVFGIFGMTHFNQKIKMYGTIESWDEDNMQWNNILIYFY